MALSSAKRTTTVILDAETDRLLDRAAREHRPAMRAFIEDVERRAFLYAPPTDGQLARAMQVDAKYAAVCPIGYSLRAEQSKGA